MLITNGIFRLILKSHAQDCDELRQRCMGFLQPYFWETKEEGEAHLQIHLHPATHFPTERINKRKQNRHQIRRSTAAIFNLEVVSNADDEAGLLFTLDEARQVGYAIDRIKDRVDFYSGLNGFVHLIELIRYYGLLIEQAAGTALLHASAVVDEKSGMVIGIVGPKGSGKTSTMLNMVCADRWRYFSGDKLLARLEEGHVVVRGWPDFPHVGWGSLKGFPHLVNHFESTRKPGNEALCVTDKLLFEPEEFRAIVPPAQVSSGRLGAILLPEVGAKGPRMREALDERAKRCLSRDELFEFPSDFVTATWHGLSATRNPYQRVVANDFYEALIEIPWETWKGTCSPKEFQSGLVVET